MPCSVTGQTNCNQTPLVVITSAKSVGCTFLDWSLLYLYGIDQHYSIQHDTMVPVCKDPLDTKSGNAHRHHKNHPSGRERTLAAIDQLRQHQQGFDTLYPHTLQPELCLNILGHQSDTVTLNAGLHDRMLDLQMKDYRTLLDDCLDLGLPLIFVESDIAARGYFWHVRAPNRFYAQPGQPRYQQDVRNDFDQVFFSDSRRRWQDLNLQQCWDDRERMALDMRPFDKKTFVKIALNRAYQHVNCQDLWHMTGDVVRECFNFLGARPDEARWRPWQLVAQRWQHIQHCNLRFYNNLAHIVDATVNNWYLLLPRMPLWQEAVIQHCLIYQHDLNIRTWQLEHFPDNTQKLHELLEPNQHAVPAIY